VLYIYSPGKLTISPPNGKFGKIGSKVPGRVPVGDNVISSQAPHHTTVNVYPCNGKSPS